jgi:hypothetical protein
VKDGWIKLYRSSFENDLYFQEPFTMYMAWVDLLLLANHKDTTFFKRGNMINVPRGTVARSMKELADRWKWSENKVSRFIKFLESENVKQVKAQKSNLTTLITILKYDLYQSNEGAELGTEVGTESAQTRTYKNVKNEKEIRNNITLPVLAPQNSGLVRGGLKPPPTPPADVVFADKKFEASDFTEGFPNGFVERLIKAVFSVKQKTISEDEVKNFWEMFLQTELCKKTYPDKQAVFGHFFNYVRKQPFSKDIKTSKKAESILRPFTGEIRGLKFTKDFTHCEMEDGTLVKLDANKRDMAMSNLLSPQNVKK